MKAFYSHKPKDQSKIDDLFSKVNKLQRVGKELSLFESYSFPLDLRLEAIPGEGFFDISTFLPGLCPEPVPAEGILNCCSFPAGVRLGSIPMEDFGIHSIRMENSLHQPSWQIAGNSEVETFPELHALIAPFPHEISHQLLKEQLTEVSQELMVADIENFETRNVARLIKAHIKAYNATEDERLLYRVVRILFKYKQYHTAELKKHTRKLRDLAHKFFNHFNRDIRQVFRHIIRFLFKNMDSDTDDSEGLFQFYLKQNSFIRKRYQVYANARYNNLFNRYVRVRSYFKLTDEDRTGRNNYKTEKPPHKRRTYSTHYSFNFTFGI